MVPDHGARPRSPSSSAPAADGDARPGAGAAPAARPDRRRHRPRPCSSSRASATAGQRRRCEFVVVRDPDVRHQLARAYRQGWSIYRRVLHTRAGDDALLEARQWEADHFEDVPVIVVACVRGRRPRVPGDRRGHLLRRRRSRRCRTSCSPRPRSGPRRAASTLPLWSRWEARRTLGLPARGHAGRRGADRLAPGRARPRAPVAPVGNLVHLDRWGHQPFRARPALTPSDAPRRGSRGIMVVTTPRQVTTCPEKDERAGSAKRESSSRATTTACSGKAPAPSPTSTASPTTTSRTTTIRRRRRRTKTTTDWDPDHHSSSSGASVGAAQVRRRVAARRGRSRSARIASATVSPLTSPVWASPSSTPTVTWAASISKWRRNAERTSEKP